MDTSLMRVELQIILTKVKLTRIKYVASYLAS